MNFYVIATMAAITGLAGCSDSTVTGGSLNGGTVPANFTVTHNAGADTLTISNGTTTKVLPRDPSLDAGDFVGYFDTDPNYGARAVTSTGSGTVTVIASDNSEFDANAYLVTRTGSTSVPSTGSVDYTGTYYGWYTQDSTRQMKQPIKGTAAVTADFGSNSVSGTITNRENVFDAGDTYADVTLNAATIAGGKFSGNVTGGEGTGTNTTTTSGGTYSGLFTGANGDEVVGGIVLKHDQTGTAHTEVGGFIGE